MRARTGLMASASIPLSHRAASAAARTNFRLAAPGSRPFSTDFVLVQPRRDPPRWTPGVESGWVAFEARVPHRDAVVVANAAARCADGGDVLAHELAAAWRMYFQRPQRMRESDPGIVDDFHELCECDQDSGGAAGQSAELRDARNALLARIFKGVDFSPRGERALDKASTAVVPHAPPLPAREMQLKGGGRVWLRHVANADPRLLTQFLEDLDDEGFRLRFPLAQGSREELAVQFVHEGSEGRGVFVVQDETGRLVGLADYEACDVDTAEVGLVIAPGLRASGLGTQLLRHAVRAAREAGFDKVTGTVADTNGAMRHVLHKMGAGEGEPFLDAAGERWYKFGNILLAPGFA